MINKFKNLNAGSKFLLIVILLYLIISFLNLSLVIRALKQFLILFAKISPSLILVFFFIFIFNFVFPENKVKKYLLEAGSFRKYLLAMLLGVLSSGPIYIWFSFLANLREKGLSNDIATIFLYNRAIKIPLLPIMLYYFSLKFTLLLFFLMLIFSVLNGIAVNKLVNRNTVRP